MNDCMNELIKERIDEENPHIVADYFSGNITTPKRRICDRLVLFKMGFWLYWHGRRAMSRIRRGTLNGGSLTAGVGIYRVFIKCKE